MAAHSIHVVVQPLDWTGTPLHVVVQGDRGISAAQAALYGAIIAAVAAIAAAVLTAFYESHVAGKSESAAKKRAAADRITEQLSGLYGPLRMLTEQSRALALKLREGKADPAGWHLLDHLDAVVNNPADKAIAQQIIAANGEVEQRILSGAGLLEDGTIPNSFREFLGHYRLLTIAFGAAVEAKEVPREITAKEFAHYPATFDEDVARTYDALQARRKGLLQ